MTPAAVAARRILLVEDDAVLRSALCRVLRGLVGDVIALESAESAAWCSRGCDLAVLDINLPGINGVELAGQLLGRGSVPKVVFYTGETDTVLLSRARRLGEVVPKGNLEHLLHIVETML